MKPIQISDIQIIDDLRSFSRFKAAVSRSDIVTVDSETESLDYAGDDFLMTALANGEPFLCDRRQHEVLYRDVMKFLFECGKPFLGHHLGFDLMKWRLSTGLRFEGECHDTLLLSFLINENDSHRLKDLAEVKYPGVGKVWEDKVIEWLETNNGGKKEYAKVPNEILYPYAAQDVVLTRGIFDDLHPIIKGRCPQLYDTERTLIKVLLDMRVQGVKLDTAYLKSLIPQFEAQMAALEKSIVAAAGSSFNISSDVQLADVLYRKLQMKADYYTDGGKPAVDKNALLKLQHPIGKMVLEYRDLETSLTTFIQPWLDYADKHGYLHPYLNQTGARSGRFSSSAPNCQQIPKRTPSAKILRKAFIYPEGLVGGSTDQSQIEMAGFAHYSGDRIMQEALQQGKDLHRATAVQMGLAKAMEEVTPDQRKLGKGSNFAIIFGCGANKLAAFLSGDQYAGRPVSPEEAGDLRMRYRQNFPGVMEFTNRCTRTVKMRDGHYVENLFGRRAHLSIDKAYVAVNRLVQGWSADFMKWGMTQVWKYAQGTDLRLNLQIHDDLRYVCEEKNFKDHATFIDKILTNPPHKFSVPLKTETTFSRTNWADETVYAL